MALPAEWNIRTRQGASYTKGFVWNIDGEPHSFEGYHIESQIKPAPGGTLIKDIASYFQVEPDSTPGRFVLILPGDVTKELPQNSVWDLFVVNDEDNTNAQPLLFGAVEVDRAVTDV